MSDVIRRIALRRGSLILGLVRPKTALARWRCIHEIDFMTPDVRQHLSAAPFETFSIVTSSGHRYAIASPDQAGIHPCGSRVVVWFDDDSSVTISAMHIVAIEKNGSPPKRSA